ncbi:MAG TPA: MBL fold metallo-hydrolase [Aridibacter sp.]|nr:MBL fold metallo-hydrolase [Aridibacter sp.]
MRTAIAFLITVLIFAAAAFGAEPYVLVLGVGQDAGVPQMGCGSPFCERAWKDGSLRRTVSSIALVDPRTKKRWIFDATPDLAEQFQMLKEKTGDYSNGLSGIFLTHAHIGHYTGLIYLGRESMNSKGVPVYAMPRMAGFLESNGPWSQLVELNNIEVRRLKAGEAADLGEGLSVTPFLVPHRDEFSETAGFRISFGTKSLVFIPDIDKWQKWDRKLAEVVSENDYLLVDATFFKDGEIPRPISEVPHPFITETIDLLKERPVAERNKVYLIHFNHSNPVVQGDAEAIRTVTAAGLRIAEAGMVLPLGAGK